MSNLEAPKKSGKRLPEKRFQLKEQAIVEWFAVLENGSDYKEVFDSAFWAHVAGTKLRPNDEITVTNDEMSFNAVLKVVACGPNWAKVEELYKKDYTKFESLSETVGYEAMWKGPALKHCVVRLSDKKIMQEGFISKSDAQRAAIDFAGRVAA